MVGGGGALGLRARRSASPSGCCRRSPRSRSSPASGLLMQQLLLRWNQGQDLRQALITIAVSIILADQMLAHFGGVARGHLLAGHVRQVRQPPGLRHPVHADAPGDPRHRPRDRRRRCGSGSSARAPAWSSAPGVDDRDMVSAMGINIQLTFAIAFTVGSGAGRPGRRDRRLVREPRPGRRRQLAAELARRRDHRRHGLAGRRRDRRRCCSA